MYIVLVCLAKVGNSGGTWTCTSSGSCDLFSRLRRLRITRTFEELPTELRVGSKARAEEGHSGRRYLWKCPGCSPLRRLSSRLVRRNSMGPRGGTSRIDDVGPEEYLGVRHFLKFRSARRLQTGSVAEADSRIFLRNSGITEKKGPRTLHR